MAIGDGFSLGQFVPEDEAWPSRMDSLLASRGHVMNSFQHICESDHTAADLLQAVNQTNPDCYNTVTILVGANDHFQGKSNDDFRINYRDLLEEMIALTGNTSRVTCVSLPDYSSAPGLPNSAGNPIQAEQRIQELNAIILEESLAAGAEFANIFPLNESAYENLDAYVAEDELHPDVTQHELWAEIVFAVLEANL